MKALLMLLCLALLVPAAPPQIGQNDLLLRAKSALAQTSGEIKLTGLKKTVTVYRDAWGVPHIFAETTDDLFFAQGFVAAQDRLWQMELWRRAGEGKLAEILGPAALERDKFARLIRYRGDLAAEYRSYAPDAKQIIAAFTRGVNAFIDQSSDNPPIEFQLLGIKPEHWTPEVCLTRLAGYTMTRNLSSEVLNAQLVQKVGAAEASRLIETDPFKMLAAPDGLDLAGIDNRILAGSNAVNAPVNLRANDGSNNWVVSGKLTASGKPLLANDPHRAIALPSLRYLTHLVGPGWNVIGAGEPALPGVAAGHNERVAFGFTIVGIDQQDLYVEELNPQNQLEYRDGPTWRKMSTEQHRFNIKGQAPVKAELNFTKHGPVIFLDKEKNRAYALRWVGSEPGAAGYLACLSLNRAKNWPEFLRALERWKVPSENLVYADVDGNIGYQAAGLAPIRQGWSGLLPVPGANDKYEWQGFLPLAELPRQYNPKANFIATANHKIIPEGYRREINFEWSSPIRFWRIEEALKAGSRYTVEDFMRLQHDEFSWPARELMPLLKNLKSDDAATSAALKLLSSWDLKLSQTSAAAALYEIWLSKLPAAVMRPRTPPEVQSLIGARSSLLRVMSLLKTPDEKFGATPQVGRDALLLETLKQAMVETTQRLGNNLTKWQWGTLHQADFRHALSGNSLVKAAFDLPSAARGGDGNAVNATSGGNFRQSHGASFREVIDVSDWDKSMATSVPGQSGQPGSLHYGDLLPLWANGEYFPLLYSRAAIEQQAKEKLLLRPKN